MCGHLPSSRALPAANIENCELIFLTPALGEMARLGGGRDWREIGWGQTGEPSQYFLNSSQNVDNCTTVRPYV